MIQQPIKICGVDFDVQLARFSDGVIPCVRVGLTQYIGLKDHDRKVAEAVFGDLKKELDKFIFAHGNSWTNMPIVKLKMEDTYPGEEAAEPWQDQSSTVRFITGATEEDINKSKGYPASMELVYAYVVSKLDHYAKYPDEIREAMGEKPIVPFVEIEKKVHEVGKVDYSREHRELFLEELRAKTKDGSTIEGLREGIVFDVATEMLADRPSRLKIVEAIAQILNGKPSPKTGQDMAK